MREAIRKIVACAIRCEHSQVRDDPPPQAKIFQALTHQI
jgi:hypothetical protein